jgi:hypothetical protein
MLSTQAVRAEIATIVTSTRTTVEVVCSQKCSGNQSCSPRLQARDSERLIIQYSCAIIVPRKLNARNATGSRRALDDRSSSLSPQHKRINKKALAAPLGQGFSPGAGPLAAGDRDGRGGSGAVRVHGQSQPERAVRIQSGDDPLRGLAGLLRDVCRLPHGQSFPLHPGKMPAAGVQ